MFTHGSWCHRFFFGSFLQVAPAVRPDYYSAVIKRSGEGAVGGATGAAAAGAGGGGRREGNGGQDATSSGAGIVSQPHGQALGPATALRSTPQGTPSAVPGSAPGVVGHPGATGFAGTAGAPAPGAQPPPASASSVSVQNQGVSGGNGGGAAGAGGRKGGVKVGPLATGSSSKSKGLTGDGKGAVIRMRGLPYRASKSEVMGFFKGCSIPEEGIAFVTRADGRVTGEAYVRFATREDAKMGIRKDREMMVRGDRERRG